MHEIRNAPEFAQWLDGLRDRLVRVRLLRRLDRARQGNLGDVKPVGDGVFEMREHFGAGWRMYYQQRGQVLVLMLSGGVKATQQNDIAKAIALAKTLKD